LTSDILLNCFLPSFILFLWFKSFIEMQGESEKGEREREEKEDKGRGEKGRE
jgi:hypothetical protein